MRGFDTKLPRLGLLRVAFALAFVVLSCLQPGLFAVANATGLHNTAAAKVAQTEHAHHRAVSTSHDGHLSSEVMDGETLDHNGVAQPVDKSCEVHCAPAQAMPVDCPPLPHPSGRCFQSSERTALRDGLVHELTQPPRT